MIDDPLPTEALLDGCYALHECVGQGGMARVHRAHDVLLGRTVAIKLLRTEMDGTSSSGRARSEMTVLASLNHPALVTLYDAQLVPGKAEYLVMEFVDGSTLSARIAQGPLAPSAAAALAADLAEALHVVHSAGIVHRDIKPSNVLMSGSPLMGSRSGAKLADFGISVLVDAARLTTPGVVVGTAAYLAPEQLRGAPPAPPADIYSLGLVLLEALTGRRAFPEAEGIGAAMARLIETPQVPASLGPEWCGLLEQMLTVEPGDRPSASAVFSTASKLMSTTAPAGLSIAASATAPTIADMGGEAFAVPTLVLPAGGADAGGAPARKVGIRRRGIVGAVAAAGIAASIFTGVWLMGNGVADRDVSPVDTEQSPATTPAPSSTPVMVPEHADVPVVPVEDARSGSGDPKDRTAEDARKEAEEAARDAEKEQRKAEEEAQKNEEKAEK